MKANKKDDKKIDKITKNTKEQSNKNNKQQENKNGKIKEKAAKFLKNKLLLKRSTTILLVLIIFVCYFGLTILLQNITLPDIDCTENKLYSLSDESKDKVGGINKEINMTLINYSHSDSVTGFAEKYQLLNNNIKIEKIDDLSARSDIMQKYGLSANDSVIIINCGETEKVLTATDLQSMDYTTYQSKDVTEEAITNAIVNVSSDDKPKMYMMTAHMMYDYNLYAMLTEYIKDESNEIENLDILTKGEIPEDCDCLIITTLKDDITELERDKIIEYINKGGNLLLLCGSNYMGADLKNFQTVLDQYGTTIENGMIFEGEASNMLSGYPDILVEDVQNTEINKQSNSSMKVCMIDASNIKFNENKLEELKVEQTPIAQTSSKSFIRTNLQQNSVTRTNEDKEPAQSTIGALVTKTVSDDKKSKMIIYSNELFAMNQPLQLGQYQAYAISLYNNKDVLLNSIAYLNEKENLITIRKDDNTVTYTATQDQTTIVMTIIFTVPVLIIIAGIVIWQIRRRKN